MVNGQGVCYSNDGLNLDLIKGVDYIGAVICVEMYHDQDMNKLYSFCGTQEGLLIIDITDPNIPRKAAFLEMGKIKGIAFYQ